jgi:hypothetical protein
VSENRIPGTDVRVIHAGELVSARAGIFRIVDPYDLIFGDAEGQKVTWPGIARVCDYGELVIANSTFADNTRGTIVGIRDCPGDGIVLDHIAEAVSIGNIEAILHCLEGTVIFVVVGTLVGKLTRPERSETALSSRHPRGPSCVQQSGDGDSGNDSNDCGHYKELKESETLLVACSCSHCRSSFR